jgi:hypothetical protein
MEDYSFRRDFFDTYQSLSDWLKFAWLVVPPISALGLVALILRYCNAGKQTHADGPGDFVYSGHSDQSNQSD